MPPKPGIGFAQAMTVQRQIQLSLQLLSVYLDFHSIVCIYESYIVFCETCFRCGSISTVNSQACPEERQGCQGLELKQASQFEMFYFKAYCNLDIL